MIRLTHGVTPDRRGQQFRISRQAGEDSAVSGLRFCFITTFYPPNNFGGDGVAIQRMARALVKRGHQVTVIHDLDAFKLMNTNGVTPASRADNDGVERIPLRSGFGALAPMITHQLGMPLINRRRILEILARGNFDVIMYNNISLVGGPRVLAYGSALKLYFAHEYWLVCPMHLLWRDDREPCVAQRCLRCTLIHRRPPQPYRWTGMLERNLRHVDTFIVPSDFSRRKHREFNFAHEIEVLPYFLPELDSDPTAVATRMHDRPYFLFVGRLERAKGAQDLIAAFRTYADADLLIAGAGNYRSELEALSIANPRIKFLGRVEEPNLRRYYRDAIAVLVPSLCYETFGLILIEAFRESTPVIARRRGPLPELIEQSGGGEVFSDQAELLAAMRRLQGDLEYRSRLGREGHCAYHERWSADVIIPRFLEIVRETARRRKRADIADAISDAQCSVAVEPVLSPAERHRG
jgi:glycosyltransferase involved in cell wall biosynthesis